MQILTAKPSLICIVTYLLNTIRCFFLFITFSREGGGRLGVIKPSHEKNDFNIQFSSGAQLANFVGRGRSPLIFGYGPTIYRGV